MSWAEVLVALLVSHAVGDVLLQTEWQAITKTGGLTAAGSRRALLSHLGTYCVAFLPALVWVAVDHSPARAIVAGVVIATSHLVIDDGRLVRLWLRDIKRAQNPSSGLVIAVDQALHLLCLLAAAFIAA
jgi:hypothetical protein